MTFLEDLKELIEKYVEREADKSSVNLCGDCGECPHCYSKYNVKYGADILKPMLIKALETLSRLSVSGCGAHKDRKESFYDSLPCLQIEFDERKGLANDILSKIEEQLRVEK